MDNYKDFKGLTRSDGLNLHHTLHREPGIHIVQADLVSFKAYHIYYAERREGDEIPEVRVIEDMIPGFYKNPSFDRSGAYDVAKDLYSEYGQSDLGYPIYVHTVGYDGESREWGDKGKGHFALLESEGYRVEYL